MHPGGCIVCIAMPRLAKLRSCCRGHEYNNGIAIELSLFYDFSSVACAAEHLEKQQDG